MTTSRIGRKPVQIPKGVEIKVIDQNLMVKGIKGQLELNLPPTIKIENNGNELKIYSVKDSYTRTGTGSRFKKSIIGTIRSKVNNIITGVTSGFEKKLILVGVGFRAITKDNSLNLTIGYSHPVVINAPTGITIQTPSQTEVIVQGIDKQLVGHVAAIIRAVRCPEPYKGKGIRYSNENVICKETKKK